MGFPVALTACDIETTHYEDENKLTENRVDNDVANEQVMPSTSGDTFQKNTIEFGGIDWLVLAEEENQTLIISEYILELRPFHETTDPMITWEHSTLRQYLNHDFLEQFAVDERQRIVETTLINNDNPWFGTAAGNNTVDHVFLLSLEEVVRYFGDSGILTNPPYETMWAMTDQYGDRRIAYLHPDANINDAYTGGLPIYPGASWMWLLRSPGGHEKHIGDSEVAYVFHRESRLTRDEMIEIGMQENEIEAWELEEDFSGAIDVEGIKASGPNGIRPAMWIRC